MANRLFKPMGGSLTQDVVVLTGKWTLGSGGAISSSSSTGFSIGTVDSDGQQVITLDDVYNDLVAVNLTYQNDGSFAAAESTAFEVESETVSSSKTITIQHINIVDGTKQTQANLDGKVVRCMVWLKNSGV